MLVNYVYFLLKSMQIVMFIEKVFNVCKVCQAAVLNATGMCPSHMPRFWDKSKTDMILLPPPTRIDQCELIVSDDIIKILSLKGYIPLQSHHSSLKKYLIYHFCENNSWFLNMCPISEALPPFKSSTLIVLHTCLLVRITESDACTCI